MSAFRLMRVLLHLLRGLSICAFIFPFVDAAARSAHVQSWSSRLLVLCRVSVDLCHASAGTLASRAMIVANHVSWLDIFVINSVQPCRFVAKSDIRGWPLIGWLCDKAGTIFIARGRVRDVRRIYQGLVTSLENGEHVAFFPEGTTAAQGSLLPFHANLFEAAIEAKVPVQPYALRYVDARNDFHTAVNFIGDMTFVQSMLAILRAEPMKVQLTPLPPLETVGSHRRELADAAHAAIAGALGIQIDPGR
jgi:1-acyl-sn-glycerol-3-phosphate acyltransferase